MAQWAVRAMATSVDCADHKCGLCGPQVWIVRAEPTGASCAGSSAHQAELHILQREYASPAQPVQTGACVLQACCRRTAGVLHHVVSASAHVGG
eukprot:364417-Chlamydomonas_euryale.AAC.3